jgi:hypothetical protein
MRSSSAARRAAGTAALTAALAGVLALLNWRLPLTIIDFAGVARAVWIGTIWETFFARLPLGAPGILARGPLLVGVVVAVVALAYILVATWRLPD